MSSTVYSAQEMGSILEALSKKLEQSQLGLTKVAGIPRGGLPVATYLAARLRLELVDFENAISGDTLIADDIYDSGATLNPYLDAGFVCAVALSRHEISRQRLWAGYVLGMPDYIVFPWEKNLSFEDPMGPDDAVIRLLEWLGYNPSSPSLKETPRRVLGWLGEFADRQPLDTNLTAFDGETYDEMIVVRDIPFVSLCEHHMLPFTGSATVAYIPAIAALGRPGPIIGLSKLARIVVWRAKRLQVQERLTDEICNSIGAATKSPNVAVSVEAEHMCMTLRGAKSHGSKTITNALSGVFKSDAMARSEFLALARR